MNKRKLIKRLGLLTIATIVALATVSTVSAEQTLMFEQTWEETDWAGVTAAYDTANAVDYEPADNFWGLQAPVNQLIVPGLAAFHDGTEWIEMTLDATEPFIVRFYEANITGGPLVANESGTYQICLEDSYGDGWNGCSVTVYVNNVAVLDNITLASGYGPECHNFTANAGDNITTEFFVGSYPSETSYYILDPFGTQIADDGTGGTQPTGIGGYIWEEPDWANPISMQNITVPTYNTGVVHPSGFTIWNVTINLTNTVDMEKGWVSLQINADAGSGSWFLWLNSYDGDLYSHQRTGTFLADNARFSKAQGRDVNDYDQAMQIYGDVVIAPVVNVDSGEGFDHIQDAIDDNDTIDGHTIVVHNGTYVEQVTIYKSLTLLADPGTIIQSPANPNEVYVAESTALYGYTVGIFGGTYESSNNTYWGTGTITVEMDGFIIDSNQTQPTDRYCSVLCRNTNGVSTIHDNVITNTFVNGKQTFGLLGYGTMDIIVENNLVDQFGRGGIGMYSGYAEVIGNTVIGDDNTTWATNGIQLGYGASGLIQGNEVSYCGWPGSSWSGTGIIVVDTSNVVVDDNYVHDTEQAIGVVDFPECLYGSTWAGVVSNVEVTNNNLQYNSWGIVVANDCTDVSIEYNIINDTVGDAVDIYTYDACAPPPTNVNVNYNNIDNCGYDGIWVGPLVTDTVDATCNWFGDASGPYNATLNPNGNGMSVVGNALFIPWLTDEYPSGSCNGYPGPVYNIDTGEVFNTIQAAIDDVDTLNGHTIQVAAITHAEGPQIIVSKDLTIQGHGCGSTVIIPTGDTGNSGDARGWWLVNSGVTLHLKDLELDGTGFDIYQAIRHKGSGTIDTVCFTEIKYPTYGGVAIAAFGGGPVDVTNCHFSEIGRVGVLYWVTGSLFQGNTYVGKGDGDWLDYCLDIGGGGGVTVIGNTVSGCTGVASSDGSQSAGFLVTTYYGAGTYATIEENNISDCTMAIAVGYDEFDTSSVDAHFNNFINCEAGIDTTAPVVNATCNWWGDITGPYHAVDNPSALGCNVSDNVTFLPWLNDLYPNGACIGGLEALDINQSVHDRGFPIRHAADGDWAGAQNFTPTKSTLTRVEIYLRKFGTPEFDLTVELRTGGPEGTLLDTIVFTPAEVPTSWTWVEVDFADQTLPAGTDCFIVCPPAPSGVTTSFGYEWGYAFGNQYDPGSFWFTRDGGNLWRDLPTMYEFVFKTYGA